jgi:hypothetical protein
MDLKNILNIAVFFAKGIPDHNPTCFYIIIQILSQAEK